MSNYKEMYITLFNELTQAINCITQVADILKEAQRETEEMYISAEGEDLQ